jgi:hypothetical protein
MLQIKSFHCFVNQHSYNINNCKKGKEDIKTKLDKGIFKTRAKPNTATATWWENFLRIQDDKGL